MFTRLRLTNFKAWKSTGNVDLKPVTMLLGTNSSGKSTLIQSLLLLKQTIQSPDRTVHLNLGGDETTDLFNFGGFNDVLTQGIQGARQFSIGFDFHRGGSHRVNSGQFDCTYGQTATGSVAIQALDLQTDEKSTPGEIGIDGRSAVDALLASALLKGQEHNRIVKAVSL